MNEVDNEDEENCFWEKGIFIETMSSEEAKEKMKTFDKKHNEDTNYNCRKCGKKISAHNKDWHGCLCDDCFHNELQ